MFYKVNNGYTASTYFNSEINPNAKTEAQALLISNQQTYIQNRIQNFHIAKIITNDIGEVWLTANQDTDPNEGNYQTFNYTTGLYEISSNLAEAVATQEKRKQELLTNAGLDQVFELEQMPPALIQGLQTL
jgi:hypothetical protein